jgi:TolB-like protein/tetratricopeptide (TPR) repeat protein
VSFFAELRRRNVFRVAAAYVVVGWLLTEVLTTLLPAFGAPDWMSRAVMLIFALGFLPTIVLSWVYEITPQGIRKDHEVDRESADRAPRSFKLELLVIGTVIVGVILISVVGSRTDIATTATNAPVVDDASVAVLPFVNLSGSNDNQYFSDGLTETLLHMLTQYADLKVAARTSSFAFRDSNLTIKEIARALEVAHVLEGSVQRSGDRVRITAQLIRASDGFHVWSSNFDRTVEDIFAIQDEIAAEVGSALSLSLLGDTTDARVAATSTQSADAYDIYLQALESRSTFSYEGLRAAESLLKGALAIDPDFLEAKVELAAVYWHQIETGLKDQQTAASEIIALVDQVLAVRPEDVNARAIRQFASVAANGNAPGLRDMAAAIEELESIVDENPDAIMPHLILTRLYQAVQQPRKAISLLQEELDRDPYNARILYELGSLFLADDRFEEAEAALRKSLEIEPAQPNVYANLGNLRLEDGDAVGYLQMYLAAMKVDPMDHELPGLIAVFLYELGLIEEGDDFRDRVMAIAPTSEIAYQIELLRAINIGDEIASVASARRAIEDDINDRRFSYGGAVQHLLRVAARRGTVGEELEYLEAQAPGILDIDDAGAPPKYRTAQVVAFDGWYVYLPREEVVARFDRLRKMMISFGFDPLDDPGTRIAYLALKGDTNEAADLALEEFFSESVATNLGWRRGTELAQYAPVQDDPRIQAAISKWEAEEEVIRGQVRAFLEDLSTAT